MAYTKAEQFSEDQASTALYAKSLAHPARVAILQILRERKQCICGDIVEQLPLSQSTVSQHLKELKAVKLVKGQIDGPRIYYSIDEENWKLASMSFEKLFRVAKTAAPAEMPDYYKKRKNLLAKIKSEENV